MKDSTLAEAVERDFVAAWWLLAEVLDVERHDGPSLRWFHTGLPDAYLNPVLGTRLAADRADAVIDATLDDLRRRGSPFLWWVLPSSTPSDLATRLEARGLVEDGSWPAMAAGVRDVPDPAPVPGLEIRRVASDADLDLYAGIFSPILSPSAAFTELLVGAARRIGYGEEAPEEHFVGWLDDEPVATVSLLTAGGSAGIYNVTTVDSARRRGIGAAMTAAAVRHGAARGFETATLQASSMGRPVYERLGFRFVCDFVPYRLAG